MVRGEPRAYRWEMQVGRRGRWRRGWQVGRRGSCGACPGIGYVTLWGGVVLIARGPQGKASLAGRLAALTGGCTAAPGASDAPASVKGKLEELGKARGAGSPPLPSGPRKLAEVRGD